MFRRSKVTLALLALAAVALAIPALSLAGKNTVEVTAKLKGNNEVPGPGDKNGKGEVQVLLKKQKKKVCFNLGVSKLDPVTAGHIHKGTADVSGDVKVLLFEDQDGLEGTGFYEGCTKGVKKKLIKRIGKKPEKYYVNIHTIKYPDGAIRGQLEPTQP
jgi:hypothetical protein